MESRERLVYKAKLAEQAERYKEMKQYMSDVAKDKTNKDLSTEERNLLSVAFKNVIGSRRASWRVIQSIADSETDDSRTKILDEYRTVIETEIETICEEILQIIDGLVANSEETEPKVFYLKMKGDYGEIVSGRWGQGAFPIVTAVTVVATLIWGESLVSILH